MGYFDRINEVLDAGTPVLLLRTSEFERSYAGLKKWCKLTDAVLYRWNCVEGLLEMSLNFDTVMAVDERVSDIAQVLVEIERRQDSQEVEVFVVEGLLDFMERADVKALLRKLTIDIPKSGNRKRVVLLSPLPDLPEELWQSIPVIDLPKPDAAELAKLLVTVSQGMMPGVKIPEDIAQAIVAAANGMTAEMATLAFKLAAIRNEYGPDAPTTVSQAKLLYVKPQR